MASTLNADNGSLSGSSGLKGSGDASGVLALQTNGTTALTIDTSQNVGIGTTSPSAKLDIASGNLSFSGSAQRITGDFSNATIANRVAFQTSTTNGATALSVIPNGTNTVSLFRAYNNSDLTNGSYLTMQALSTEVSIQSSYGGTGSYLPMTFYTGGSERMRIDTSGNVGIGTNSPTALLQVGDGTGSKLALIKGGTSGTNGGGAIVVQNGGTSNIGIGNYSAINGGAYNSFPVLWFQQGLAFFDNATERMRIDSSGNVGIGVTPTTCNGGTLFQVSLVSNLLGTSNTMYLQNNATYNSGWKYITSSYATQYIQVNGEHSWLTAPSGTAGNTISFTESMRIDSSGNLLVGGVGGTSRITAAKTVSPTAYNLANVEAYTTGGGNVIISMHSGGISAVCLRHQSGINTIQARNLVDTGFIPFEASAFTVSSDYRLKENIVPLTGALERLSNLPVHRFNFKSPEEIGDDFGSDTVDGLLAHELANVVPEAVFGEKDAVKNDGTPIYQSIDKSKLIPLLIASIQELKAEVDSLKAQLNK